VYDITSENIDQKYLEKGRTIRKISSKIDVELKYQNIELLADTTGNKKADVLRTGENFKERF
jgi:hypothetical protein